MVPSESFETEPSKVTEPPQATVAVGFVMTAVGLQLPTVRFWVTGRLVIADLSVTVSWMIYFVLLESLSDKNHKVALPSVLVFVTTGVVVPGSSTAQKCRKRYRHFHLGR